MSQYKYAEIADTVYFWFAANTTAGSGGDGATPLYDVRKAGDAAGGAPTASGTPILLTHANYADGIHEIAIDTTGYSAGEYAVFCTLTISSVNPSGFCGSFKLRTAGTAALAVDTVAISGDTTAADNCEADYDGTGYAGGTIVKVADVTKWLGTAAHVATTGGIPVVHLHDPGVGSGGLNAPTNFDDLAIVDTTGLVDITQAAADKVWSTAARILTAGTNIVLAKGVGVTGFNDIAATSIVSGGAITTSGGAVSTVTNTTQLNGAATVVLTDASSDAVIADAVWNAATVTYGAAGSYGLLIETDLDATISSRMATYTQPTGFLAATFPTTVASTTNITGGTITTATNVTNGVTVATNNDKTGYALSATGVDAIWDEEITVGHTTADTAGKKLNDAGAAGDPWSTALPGAYGAGTAGKIVGDNINAPIATVDTVVDAIKVKTDFLPSATAGAAGGVFIAGSNAATSVTTALTANITGNLSGSVGSVTGAVGSVTAGVTVTTNNDKTGYGLSSAAVQAIWDALTSALTTIGSIGKLLVDNINAAITSRSSHSAADVVTSLGTGTTLTDIPWNAAWDAEVQSECTDALNAYDPPTNAEMEARTLTATSYGTVANQTTIIGYIDTEVASILAAVDTEVGAIKAVTDKLDTALVLDVAVYQFTANALELAPSGGLDAAGVRAAVGLVSANLDTQLADIPTVAEFNARTLPSADYVVVTDTIAGVTLVGTCTTNTDMRGTDNAALASVCTELRLAELDAANLPADIAAISIGVAPTVVQIRQEMDSNSTIMASILEDTGTTLPAQIAAIPSAAGAGAISWPYTLTDSATSLPIDGAEVWVTSDSLGTNIIASGMTNASGVVTFMLNAGTYYIWRSKAGWNFANPDQESVS